MHCDRDAIAAAVSALLRAAGHDPSGDSDLRQTPERVAKLWVEEFLAGYDMDPAKILGEPVLGESSPDVVVVSGLRFHSMCPHHLVPFRGVAHVAYMPAGRLAGFGRLADLVECLTKRLTLQERATHQIAEEIWQCLSARGAGCVRRDARNPPLVLHAAHRSPWCDRRGAAARDLADNGVLQPLRRS